MISPQGVARDVAVAKGLGQGLRSCPPRAAPPPPNTSLRPSTQALRQERTAPEKELCIDVSRALRRGALRSEVKEERAQPAGDMNAAGHPAAVRCCHSASPTQHAVQHQASVGLSNRPQNDRAFHAAPKRARGGFPWGGGSHRVDGQQSLVTQPRGRCEHQNEITFPPAEAAEGSPGSG